MKYIIMCGWGYTKSDIPKQLIQLTNESVVQRTIRLLKNNEVENISISTNDDRFEVLGLPILRHNNNEEKVTWLEGFYLLEEPVCYIFGDVVFSEEAIKEIVNTETEDILFFASAPPFAEEYPKKWAEPFAFKVVNYKKFHDSIKIAKDGIEKGYWKREPISWELWQVITNHKYNHIDHSTHIIINDYTCDIEEEEDAEYYKSIGV